MSVVDVTQQISDIQSRLALLAQSLESADSGAGFAAALTSATGGTAATSSTAATAATGAETTSTGVTGDDVVKAAMQYQGVPYVLGGESKSGIDCSGLVQASFKSLGIDVPRLVHQQKTIGQEVPSLKDAKPGDLIVLNGGDHVAIWMGNGQAIHAPYPGRTVSVQKAWFDDSDITTIRRVVPATSDATAGTTASSSGTSASGASSSSGLSSSALSQAVALMGMYGSGSDSSGSSLSSLLSSSSSSSGSTDSLSALLSSFGSNGSGSTAQQLLAARAALAAS